MELGKKMTAWLSTHALVVVISIALFARLPGLHLIPPGLNWDEVSMGYSAYSLGETGRDEWGQKLPLFFRSYGEWKSPVYIYVLVPFIKLFGLTPVGVRLPAAIAGIFAVYLTYYIGKKVYSERIGLSAALLLAVSPWHLMLSRPAFEAGLSLTLMLAGIALYVRNVPAPQTRQLVWSAVLLGLAPYTYNSAKIVVPAVAVLLAYEGYKKIGFRKLLLFFATLAIMAVPMMVDIVSGNGRARYAQVGITTDQELRTQFNSYRETFPLPDTVNKMIFNKYTFFAVKSFSNWTSYISPHFLLGSESVRAQHSIPFRGVLYLAEFILVIIGLTRLGRYPGLGRTLPLVLILVGFIPAAITKDAYHVLRSMLTLPAWQLLAAVGFVSLGKMKFPAVRIATTILVVEIALFLYAYFGWYPRAFARDWQYGYGQAVAYVREHEAAYDAVVFTKTYGEPQVFVGFYAQMDPGLYQSASDKWLDYERMGLPWLDQLESYSLGKYTFRDINWELDSRTPKTLFVGKKSDFYPDTPVLKSIDFPDGTNAFTIVEGISTK